MFSQIVLLIQQIKQFRTTFCDLRRQLSGILDIAQLAW